MTWTRLDDRWTDRPQLSELPYDVRWHYLAMIQFCSRTDRIDGVLGLKDARRCSDVDDPDEAHRFLIDHDFLEAIDRGLRIVEIHDHVPPPSVRMASENTKVRVRRHRAHRAGDHSLCLADHCEHVTSHVTRYPGTGQDGTGQAPVGKHSETVTRNSAEPLDRSDPWAGQASSYPQCSEDGCSTLLTTTARQDSGRCFTHRQERAA